MAASFVARAAALLVTCTFGVDGARVLAVFPYNGHSHFAMVEPLMVALSERGHDVTVISPFPRRKHGKGGDGRYVDVDVSDALPPVIGQLNVSEFTGYSNPITGLRDLCQMNHRVCELTFEHPRVRSLIRHSGPFDVVFVEAFSTECFAVFAHVFDAPLVFVRTSDYSPQLNHRVANPQNPTYLVNHLLTFAGYNMSFFQRLVNVMATVFGTVGFHAFSDDPSTELVTRYFGPDTPSVPNIAHRRTALVLVNTHHSLTQPRPLGPNVIEVGGIHIKQSDKNMANEWSNYCDSCDKGIVYVSFGSLLNEASFSEHFITSFIRAFEALPYCVLWKYKGKIKSKRIKVSKWMPQQQILSHRNVKAFITHGGLMGVIESVYFGVPMIGIPVFGDQQSNVANCVDKGIAIELDHRQITEQKLISSIQAVIEDNNYRLKILELSAKFKDRPISALETAIYWTEYVIRHSNSTNTGSPAIDLDFYQYCLLDIVVVVLMTLIFLFFVVYKIKMSTQ